MNARARLETAAGRPPVTISAMLMSCGPRSQSTLQPPWSLPEGAAADAEVADLADAAAAHEVGHRDHRRVVHQQVTDHQGAAALARQVDEPLPLATGEGQRFFDEQVLAGQQRLAADAVVRLGRGRDRDGIDRGVAEDFAVVAGEPGALAGDLQRPRSACRRGRPPAARGSRRPTRRCAADSAPTRRARSGRARSPVTLPCPPSRSPGKKQRGAPLPVATIWCRDPESNWGHTDFQSVALPAELSRPTTADAWYPRPPGLSMCNGGRDPRSEPAGSSRRRGGRATTVPEIRSAQPRRRGSKIAQKMPTPAHARPRAAPNQRRIARPQVRDAAVAGPDFDADQRLARRAARGPVKEAVIGETEQRGEQREGQGRRLQSGGGQEQARRRSR